MTTDIEALVRRAYHLAERDVLDARGFAELFTEDGVFNGVGGVTGQESQSVDSEVKLSWLMLLTTSSRRSDPEPALGAHA